MSYTRMSAWLDLQTWFIVPFFHLLVNLCFCARISHELLILDTLTGEVYPYTICLYGSSVTLSWEDETMWLEINCFPCLLTGGWLMGFFMPRYLVR